MSGMLQGLNWGAVADRLNASGVEGEDRARMMDMLAAVEQAALIESAARTAESET